MVLGSLVEVEAHEFMTNFLCVVKSPEDEIINNVSEGIHNGRKNPLTDIIKNSLSLGILPLLSIILTITLSFHYKYTPESIRNPN